MTQNHSIAGQFMWDFEILQINKFKNPFFDTEPFDRSQFMWDFEILQINKFKNPFFDTEPFDRRPIHVGFVVHKEAHR